VPGVAVYIICPFPVAYVLPGFVNLNDAKLGFRHKFQIVATKYAQW